MCEAMKCTQILIHRTLFLGNFQIFNFVFICTRSLESSPQKRVSTKKGALRNLYKAKEGKIVNGYLHLITYNIYRLMGYPNGID